MPSKNWKLYKTVEWKEKSNEIQKRDGHQCQWCSRSYQDLEDGNFLVVHHKYYLDGVDPWSYPEPAPTYITLCHCCHKEYHKVFHAPTFTLIDFVIIYQTFDKHPHPDQHRTPSFLIKDSSEWLKFHTDELLDYPLLNSGKYSFFNDVIAIAKTRKEDEK